MIILAIDTSHPSGSAALQVGEQRPRESVFGSRSSHLVEVGDRVAALLEAEGVDPSAVDRVSLVIGPGSFTGLRIGLSFVKGLYAVAGMDVVTMTSLELLALPHLSARGSVCAMVDAGKGEVYAAAYAPLKQLRGGYPIPEPIFGPRAAEPGLVLSSLGARAALFVGSGAARYRSRIEAAFGPDAVSVPDAGGGPSTAVLCRVGASLEPLSKDEVLALEPFYIRPSDAELGLLRSLQPHDRRQDRADD